MSTDLTVRNLDDGLVDRLRDEARQRGLQVDDVIAQTLEKTFPAQDRSSGTSVRRDVSGLAGTWTEDDAAEFFAAIKDLETIEEELAK